MASIKGGNLKKRDLIIKAGKAMFLWVAVAAIAVSICLVTAQFLYQKLSYNNKIITAKTEANDTLKKNIIAAEQLKKEISTLEVNQDLTAARKVPTDSNTKVILDALPSKEDKAALATSLQQAILARTNVTIKSIDLFTNSVAATELDTQSATATSPDVVSIVFTFEIEGSYDQIQSTIVDIERTILPIKLTSLTLKGNNERMTATFSAETYYQPVKTIQQKKETLTP